MDEPIVVVDVGSSSIKAGFSEEDNPSYIYPSTLSKHPRTVEVFSICSILFALLA